MPWPTGKPMSQDDDNRPDPDWLVFLLTGLIFLIFMVMVYIAYPVKS